MCVFVSVMKHKYTILCWQGIYYLCFTARQDYFILSRFNRKIGRKREIPENNHLTTRKQNLACLTCDLSKTRTHSGEMTSDLEHLRLAITGAALLAGERFSSIDVKFTNIGSRMQDSIYHILLNRTKTLKTRFRNVNT